MPLHTDHELPQDQGCRDNTGHVNRRWVKSLHTLDPLVNALGRVMADFTQAAASPKGSRSPIEPLAPKQNARLDGRAFCFAVLSSEQ